MPLWGAYQSKPGPGAAIDRSHPMAQGLLSLLPLNDPYGPPMDAAAGSAWAFHAVAGAPTWGSGTYGSQLNFNHTNRQQIIGPTFGPTLSIWTIACIWQSTAGTTTGTAILAGSGTSNFNSSLELDYGTDIAVNTSSGITSSWSYSIDLTQPHCYVFAANGSGVTLYVDGIGYGAKSVSPSNWAFTNPFCWGAAPPNSSNVDGNLSYAAIWSRCLGATEVSRLAADPWQVFGTPRAYSLYGRPTAAATLVRRTLSDRAGSRGVA